MRSESRNGTDLRRIILDRARHLLLEEGFHDLSMRKIAAASGVTATSIYLYFEGKDQLLHALIEEGFEHLIEDLKKAMQETGDEVRMLVKFMRQYFLFAFRQPEYYELMFNIRPAQMERYPAEKFRRARFGIELTTDLIRRGEVSGRFQTDDPVTTSWFIWSALHGAVSLVKARRLDVRVPVDAFLQQAVRNILSMLHAPQDIISSVPELLEPVVSAPGLQPA